MRANRYAVLVLSLCLTQFLCQHAGADTSTYVPAIKQTEKERSRWTVADWLGGYEKEGLFSRFFQGNGFTSLLEEMVDFTSVSYTRVMGTAANSEHVHSGQRVTAAIYTSIVGLKANYEATDEDMSLLIGSFNVRIYGRSLQDSHSNLEFGYRSMTRGASTGNSETFKNPYFGGCGSLYLFNSFGFEGGAYKIFNAITEQNSQMDGHWVHGMFFLEFHSVRVSTGIRSELYRVYAPSGALDVEARTGLSGSMRMYF